MSATPVFFRPLVMLELAAVLACATTGGVFFAFSTFVMRALSRLPPAAAASAMQAINVAVLTPWFLGVFLGAAAMSALAAAAALARPSEPAAPYLLIGALLYLAGSLPVTAAGNVPLNDQLALARPQALEPDAWRRWSERWTLWNHVRTATSLAAAGVFALALGR